MALAIICQVLLAAGIVNVWIVRRNQPTSFRPAGATSIEQEFAQYGLPKWVFMSVGATKLALGGMLVLGIVIAPLAVPAAALLGVLMASAIVAHVRVGDPLLKSLPAALMLLMSTTVVLTRGL